MNNVQLIGRLTRDVEIRHTSSGTAVGSFTLAVNRSFQNQQGERETDFINCVIWRKQAEILAQYTRKGSQIAVDGRIQVRNYENQQGQRVYVTEVIVNNFYFIETRAQTEQRPQSNDYGNNSNSFSQPSNNNFQNQNNYSLNNDYNQNSSPFSEFSDGGPINLSEDDLPF
ncbi:single-stranded DNA-binding protein [Tuanshanicoccus lijuaniae]|uniref:single-stranded DNA-binding protein n=1 Tax=Aerococcaceae bacterium zg-1292 TaxID=2774330 RepID=UPI0019371811|nr:single-stranded DNA-binding protein [Aerococcaceae bacterium zg-1292]MBF6625422.1 single-stranded DNA-binding protein [Aerococcaceae bacterium zg-BR9]MBF6979083.1 single-stranded DNA-binding protein [Aerococcaceae bacterium zg-BR22]MBS4456346.1 single-stranded DNA-binding protein [Aerococcaceae bacterium zg-A91]MBS4458238.1 single-stranded DNA-binding protein [Aerococcaceae bacterium zg-BR33]